MYSGAAYLPTDQRFLYFVPVENENKRIIIDLSGLPELSSVRGVFFIKIQGRPDLCWHSAGAKILEQKQESENMFTLKLLPEGRKKKVVIFPVDPIDPTNQIFIDSWPG